MVDRLPTLPHPEDGSTVDLLRAWTGGDAQAGDRLFRHLYEELHRLAARLRRNESDAHTLQTTALVNELYLRLADKRRIQWEDRSQFFAIAARLMRHILVDEARTRLAIKRGDGLRAAPLDAVDEARLAERDTDDDAILRVDECLQRLRERDPEAVELIELRYFAGLSLEQTAEALNCSRATLVRRWRIVKGQLERLLAE